MSAIAALGTSGQVLKSGGASENPSFGPMYWNNGGKTITYPTTADDYPHFRAYIARTLSNASMLVVGGTSVAATLYKCDLNSENHWTIAQRVQRQTC